MSNVQYWGIGATLLFLCILILLFGGVLIARTGIILRELRMQRRFGRGRDPDKTQDLRRFP